MDRGVSNAIWVAVALLIVLILILVVALITGNLLPEAQEGIDSIGKLGDRV